jgi:hypothetical protein
LKRGNLIEQKKDKFRRNVNKVFEDDENVDDIQYK